MARAANTPNGKQRTRTTTPAPAPARRRPPQAEAADAARDARTKKARRYYARRPLGYAGKDYDREQALTLTGLVNDEKLVRLGYVAPLKDDARTFPCRHCDGRFLSLGALNAHGDRRHKVRPKPQMEPRRAGESDVDFADREAEFLANVAQAEEERERAEETALEQAAPLNWDKTLASLDDRR